MLEAPARNENEPRFLVVEKIEGQHWPTVHANRCEKIRVISVRRARQQVIDEYESTRIRSEVRLGRGRERSCRLVPSAAKEPADQARQC